MTIQIPGYLQWVSYLTGSEWPQGDEDAMRRIGDYWRDAAEDLSDLIPDLNRVRAETLSVLMGETADAAEEQFAMLFDGDYSVDKLSQAMSALGDLADGAGTEIEYTKLQILTSLAIAAAEIAWALAAAPETLGGSLGLIPVTEAATMMAVRQIVAMLLRQLVKKLGEAMTKTLVRRLLREAAQEIAIGLGQELAIQGFQAAQGNRDGIDWKQAGIVAAASGIGGAVGSPVGEGLTRAMGRSDNPVTNAIKGALSGYGAGVAGNVAGTLGTGGELDAVSIFGGAASSAATGGVHGAKSGSHGDSNNGTGRPDTGSLGRPDVNGANASRSNSEGGNNGQQSHNGSDRQSSGDTASSTSTSSPETNSHAGVSPSQDTSAGTPATSTSQDPVSHTAPASQAPTSGDSGSSAPSESSHAPARQDGNPAQHDGGPTKETTDTHGSTNENGTPTNDSGPQTNHTGEPKLAGDPTESTGARPETTTPIHPTGTTTDPANHTTPTTPPEHTTTEPQQSAPVAQPAASAPAAPSTPSMSTPASPNATPTPTTPANNPSTPSATPAKASPTDTPAPTPRPSLSETSTTHTSTDPAGAPTARSAETHAAQDHSGQEVTDQQNGQHNQDPDAKPESAIPPVAVAPVLPHAGGDGTSTRAGAHGRPSALTPRTGAIEPSAPSTPKQPGTQPHSGQDNSDPGHHAADTHASDPAGVSGNPSESRVFGPRELNPVEDAAHQTAVENALRNEEGQYEVHADPRTNAYGNLVNDGGPEVDGRRNNCLDCSLSALASFRGDPTVSAPRFPDVLPNGMPDNRSGEHSGLQRASAWLGSPVQPVSPSLPVAHRFAALHQQIADMGPGASALVVNEWHARDPQTGVPMYHSDGRPVIAGSHATVVVYPENAAGPVWWDPQTGTTSDQPPANMVARTASLWATSVPPNQGADHGATGDKGTSSHVPGTDPTQRDIQRVPIRERMDLHGGSPPGGEFGARPGDGESDHRQTNGGRDSSIEPADRSRGAGVRDSETHGQTPARASDLSAPVDHQSATDSGRHRDDRVSADSTVTERSTRTDAAVSPDDRQTHISDSSGRTAVETGDGTRRVNQPTEQWNLAGGGDDSGLAGRDGADRIGAPRDPADSQPPRNGESPDRDGGRARPSEDPGHSDQTPTNRETRDPAQIVNELGQHRTDPDNGQTADVHDAAQRVRDQWNGLTQAERDAVIAQETREGHRTDLGDLDGLPASVRDVLNRHNLVEDMVAVHPHHADAIRGYAEAMNAHLADPANARPAPVRSDQYNPSGRLKRLASLFSNSSDARRMTRNADAAWNAVYGHPENASPRQLYTYQPMAFNGDGRIAVAVGNLDTAAAVAVHTPGITTTIRSIELNVNNAENHHIRARQEQGDLETAVVSWIGYDAPSGNPIKLARETATQQFARAGGHRLAHDVAGIAGSRSDSPNLHLFGHSYGSTTTAHAGVRGRLADYVSTVTLLGSPGAGPLTHASDFGIGANNVYVASASRDIVTWTGSHMEGTPNRVSTYLQNLSTSAFVGVVEGRYGPLTNLAMGISNLTGGLSGRLSGLGQGFDPAMSEFGANRLAAQYSSPEHLGGIKPHTRYFASEEFAGKGPVLLRDNPNVRVTESLDNFSHILTGNTDQLSLETNHRDPDAMFGDPARTRTADPALGYPANDCVPRTIDGFAERHPDTSVKQVEGEYGDRGVPRSDYERALGTRLRDATLNDILAAIRRGESVIVVDTYHADGLPAGHPGSHTYAVEPNPDDPNRPLVYEGDERTPRPWPPQGLDHVSHTQIATFHPDGTPTHPNTDTTHTPRSGDDQRIAAEHRDSPGHRDPNEHRDPTELPVQDRTDGHEYPPDHISDLLDLPAYHPGSLSDYEVRSVYLNGEQRMHALHENLVQRGVDPETRARAMFEARNELRSWARELMSDREGAERLTRENPNHSWDDIVAKYRERGLDGDDLYNTIADRSMASRPSVNESLGLDPNRPPPLPEVRGGPDDRIGAAHPDSEPTHTGETRAQSDESGHEPHRPLQNTDLPSHLPTDPVLRDQVIAEAVARAQEQHQARVDDVKKIQKEVNRLEARKRAAQGREEAALKRELNAKKKELTQAQYRADESRELIRAVSNVDHVQESIQNELRTPAADDAALRAIQQRIDEVRPNADSLQAEMRRLAYELARVEAEYSEAERNGDNDRAQHLAERHKDLKSDLTAARIDLIDSDTNLLKLGNRERQAVWKHMSPESRGRLLAERMTNAQRRLENRYAEFVASDNASAAVDLARARGDGLAGALKHLRDMQNTAAQTRQIDLDADIRSRVDEAARQYIESRIRTDGIDDPWVARELMSSEERAQNWPTLDLQHVRQAIAKRLGPGLEWQFERQMRGLTRCSADEVADALSVFHDDKVHPSRDGNIPARESFEAALRHELSDEAARLERERRFDDGDTFLDEQVAYVMSRLAALHEQDCAGAGADHIPTYIGLPVLGDASINSSLGTIWKRQILEPDGNRNKLYKAIQAIAQAQIDAGRGGEPLDIWYINVR